jgi:hypothetical protein
VRDVLCRSRDPVAVLAALDSLLGHRPDRRIAA